MKTILVPTDFSLSAKNAARYAMHLGKQMRANIKLCNAVYVPFEVPVTAPELEYDAIEQLKGTAEKMMALDQLETSNDSFHPFVEYVAKIGAVTEVVANLTKNHDISLVVIGISGAGAMGEYFVGSTSREMVEAASLPILLVPKQAAFSMLNKIAYATDLSKQDISVIHVLSGFARILDVEILIVHIANHALETKDLHRKQKDEFLIEVTNKVNYHKIYYQDILDHDIDNGLAWLAQNRQIQILAMVHRKHEFLHNIFEGSHTQKLRRRIEIPLLVFPPDCRNRVL